MGCFYPFGGYFNSSISGVTFTPEKEFFKLLFGVKITPLLGVKLAPLEELLQLPENYCVVRGYSYLSATKIIALGTSVCKLNTENIWC